MWVISLVLTLMAGWFLADMVLGRTWHTARWAAYAASAGLGVLLGPGLFSILFFAIIAMGLASAAASIGLAAILAIAAGGLWFRFRVAAAPSEESSPRKFPWTWVLWAGLAIALVLVFVGFQATTNGNPDGDWDASGIWNLRARFLAAGVTGAPEAWHRAFSQEIGGYMVGSSHPGYPLFLSSFIAGLWMAAGSFAQAAPSTVSLLISLALAILLVTSLAGRRSTATGVLAGLVLLSGELFASLTASQYSDLLQGLSFLAALVLLDAAAEEETSPWLLAGAGLAIGLAPWVKNEGQPFAIAALAVAAWRFRAKVFWLLIGAAPGLVATASLKLIAEGRESMFPATVGAALSKIATPGRWIQIATGFGKTFLDAGSPWTHPVLMLVALAIVLRFVPSEEWRSKLWLAVPILATLAAEFGLYLITTADLTWHISTSVTRLVGQVWPSLLWLLFSAMRTPEEYFAPPEPVAVPAADALRGTRKKKRS